MLGALIALMSAFAFSFHSVLIRRGVVHASAAHGAFITVILGVPLFFIATLIAGQLPHAGDLTLRAWALLAAAGVVHFVVGRFFNYKAIDAIGAARAGPIQSLSLPYSIIVAMIFLGETLTPLMVVGIVLIFIGPAVMVERKKKPAAVDAAAAPTASAAHSSAASTTTAAAPIVQMRQLEGYVSASLCSIAYGTSPILIRAALEGHSGLSVLGGMVSYSAAAAFLLLSLVVPARRDYLNAFRPATVRAFAGAGVAIFLAQCLRFIALSIAPVAVVSTLQRSSAIFTLLCTWFLNRHLELINLRLVVSILISVAGTLLLVAANA